MVNVLSRVFPGNVKQGLSDSEIELKKKKKIERRELYFENETR